MNTTQQAVARKLVAARNAFLKANNAFNIADEGGALTEATMPLWFSVEITHAELQAAEWRARQAGVFKVA